MQHSYLAHIRRQALSMCVLASLNVHYTHLMFGSMPCEYVLPDHHLISLLLCPPEPKQYVSPQAARANSISESQNIGDKCHYQVADALHQPFKDGQFDLIWSMESGEHMPNKPQFIAELTRVCTPGGKILMVTWCHR